ncbi:nucleotide sugar dehydrogenase [Methanothermus fervidus DSM 2088]|uniref:UDP-N-acetyl-D-mannosamine dehydrogenase n=1 Tax=Methanothermus fervidus (strain ATCC 43054 / DSM 2088 / JCM 10308 / V24 S) TaxID=523846 RepID=E3GXI2_METFV|nr:nucleotide sugar dehydrogenase [Methanothermus fervidus]ADP77014.1 nucleotide sugar dehydrogenase [Methanothermus fervidus DSM 2088]
MLKNKPKIAVFGLGHIGLPAAALFADKGFDVIGVDINEEVVKSVNEGKSHILEPGLDELVERVVKNGKLTATMDGVEAAKKAKIIIIVVPTPVTEKNRPDLTYISSACRTISRGLKKGDLVIVESTVPPGTCDNVVIPILEKSGLNVVKDFGVAYTPERALPHNTLYEMTHNARVIGASDKKTAKRTAKLYKHITCGKTIIVKDLVTAEMVKLMENTYRDVNIALANEFAMICESLGVDAIDAINAANYHPRVNIHTPGPGVGGHCLSVDPYFIVDVAKKKGIDAKLIRTAREINEYMPFHVFKMIKRSLKEKGKNLKGSTIGILGVAYKGNVSDTRRTPSKPLINELINFGATVLAHDPYVSDEEIEKMGAKPATLNEVLNCDCIVLMADHDDYRKISPEMIQNSIFICARPLLKPNGFLRKGILFRGVGRI